ncbi:hypothetical protein CFK39_09895 [Brachybacterium avium]|uniref:DUF4352 domain-containing protein n=1 Tax=Brachybacterium avium TaxID=2017485 RepID=A0A220UCX4_9MICO|nr:DUF4352 domain-containing protein [Brachybacterium avium]ASK66074.1 hypothetical protein CFK39_09895 [Brachybacterium avium]
MSTPYGMPPADPQPPAAPQKSRTGLYIGIACGCLLLIAVVAAVGGVGLWMFSRDGGEDGPTAAPSTSESSTEDPTDEPTDEVTEEESDDPLETPSEDPSEEPTSEAGASFTIKVSSPEEGTTLETSTETLTTENGKFIGVAVTITNDGGKEIGLDLDNFTFVDADGEEHALIYGSFSTAGPQIAPDEEADALLYADVPEDMELESITYTDAVGTSGKKIEIPVD